MGGPVPPRALSRHDGQANFSALTVIAESPLDRNLLYTGSRRRNDPADARRRPALDQPDGQRPRPAADAEHQRHRRLEARGGARLPDRRRPFRRPLRSVRLRQRGLRPDVARDRRGAAAARPCTASASIPANPNLLVVGTEMGAVCVVRPRRRTGRRSGRICRRSRSTTCCFRRARARWWRARTGAASGCSTISRRWRRSRRR